MNIFVLDTDTQKCAEYHCNKHLVKMITEHNQILSSVFYLSRGITKKSQITSSLIESSLKDFPRRDEFDRPEPYGIGYIHHPCTKWTSESIDNYYWLCELTLNMCTEYTKRYHKKHAGEDVCEWFAVNSPSLPRIGMTPHVQCVLPEHKVDSNPVLAYRQYYINHKPEIKQWPLDKVPFWWKS